MIYPYMVVAFLDPVSAGQLVEPPRLAHVTVKKKFRLKNSSEGEIIARLGSIGHKIGPIDLVLGGTHELGGDETKIVEVQNPAKWVELHRLIISNLADVIETSDHMYEDEGYLPHVTWRFKGVDMFDPTALCQTTRRIAKIQLIKRLDPEVRQVEVVAQIELIISA